MIINLTSQQSTAMELMIDFATGETEERMFLLEGFAELANLPLGLSTLTLLKVVKKNLCSSVRTYKQSGGEWRKLHLNTSEIKLSLPPFISLLG